MSAGSVCHHVSTIGQLPLPTVWKYHRHASGLIGSPTVPKSFKEERSCFSTGPGPSFCEGTDEGGRCVKLLNPVLFHDLPTPINPGTWECPLTTRW